MKTFSGVDPMLAVVVRVAAGTKNRFGGSWLLEWANEYIHDGGCTGPFPPFPFVGMQIRKKTGLSPAIFQIRME